MQACGRPIAYSYLRFSTGAQTAGDSIARQSSLAAAYAIKHDLRLDEGVTFKDLGVSGFRGKNAHQGALAAFLRLVQQDKISPGSYLLIESLDRLSRDNILRAQALLTQLVIAGINVVSLIDQRLYSAATLSSDPIGLIYALLVFVRANEESETKSLRSRENWVRKREAASDHAISTKAPFWVTVQNGEIHAIPEQSALVRRVFAMNLKGKSPSAIAEFLNAGGMSRWQSLGQPWSQSSVSRLLCNRRTTGLLPLYTNSFERGVTIRVPHSVVPNYYPTIIKHEEFLQAQDFIPDGKRRSARARFNALASLAKCSTCGHSLQLVTISSHRTHVLSCRAARISYRCAAPEVSYPDLMKLIRPKLREWITSDYLWQTQPVNHNTFRNLVEALEERKFAECGGECGSYLEQGLIHEYALEDALTTPIRGRRRLLRAASLVCQYVDNEAPSSGENIAMDQILRRIFSEVVIDLHAIRCSFYDQAGALAFTV